MHFVVTDTDSVLLALIASGGVFCPEWQNRLSVLWASGLVREVVARRAQLTGRGVDVRGRCR